MEIHQISFQWPVPADYGGVIDVYHKTRALREAGHEVVLHSYAYRDRQNPDISLSPASASHIYTRETGIGNVFKTLPYIAASRRSRQLLDFLAGLPPATPLIFEGLHTCLFLDHPALKDKIKIVRTHNVEHDYYKLLGRNTRGGKKLFFISESAKLKRFEKILRHADIILPISPSDHQYFSEKFQDVKSEYIPCFYDDSSLTAAPLLTQKGSMKPFMLYHGNLGVEENSRAADYILSCLGDSFNDAFPLILAGKGCRERLRKKIEMTPGARLIDSPPRAEMETLIREAAVVLLITNQNTGIKLKLLDTMTHSQGVILATTEMVGDPRLAPFLNIADTVEDQIKVIKESASSPPAEDLLKERRRMLMENYSTASNAGRIIDLIGRFRSKS